MRELTKEIFGNYPRDIESLKAMLGRKWKEQLEDLKLLAETYRYYPKNKLRKVYLSVSSSWMTRLFGYHRKASRVVKTALRVGMMTLVSNDVRYNCNNPRARCFVVNREVIDLVLNVPVDANVSNIVSIISITTPTTTLYNNNNVEGENIKSVNLNTVANLEISIDAARKDMHLCDVSDYSLKSALCSRYPQLDDYSKVSQRINSKYEKNSIFSIDTEPTVKRHGMQYVTFGYRPHSYFCSVPKRPEEGFLTRDDILEEKFGIWTEYDVKSSIYRVTYALNHGGKWPEEDIDLYREFWGGDFGNREARDNFKKICMLVYFNRSDMSARKSIMNPDNGIALPEGWNKEDLLGFVNDLRESMVGRIGNFYGSEIFLHEGCIYMDVLSRLIDLGFEAVEIYDCFYVKGKVGNMVNVCDNVIRDSVYRYYIQYWTHSLT